MFGKSKILVDIITPMGVKSKKYPREGNCAILKPARRGPGGAAYKVKFDNECVLEYTKGLGPFKRTYKKIMVLEGANHAIRFNPKLKEAEMPVWDRWTEEEFFKAQVIKAAGATVQRLQIPMSIYLLLALMVGMQFIALLFVTGRVRIWLS